MPAATHAVSGRMVCSRCQRPMRSKSSHATPVCDDGIALDEPVAAAVASALPRLDDWPTRQRVHHLGRALRRLGVASNERRNTSPQSAIRFDPPQDLTDVLQPPYSQAFGPVVPGPAIIATGGRRSEGSQIMAWLVVAVGTLVLAGGLGLIVWSLSAGQLHYWDLALGLSLGGQGTLILGLVLVVSRLWRNSRYATGKLQDVHARLSQLQHTAETIAAVRTAGAPAFYSDLVRGASPHVMLANLKGQVDQLAARVGSRW
jgi:hypothetical protein